MGQSFHLIDNQFVVFFFSNKHVPSMPKKKTFKFNYRGKRIGQEVKTGERKSARQPDDRNGFYL